MKPDGLFLGGAIELTAPEAVDATRVEAADIPSELSVTVAEDSWQLAPVGVPTQLHDSEIVPTNEFSGLALTVKLAEFPAATVALPGLILRSKSGTALTTCVRGFEARGLKWASPL